MKKPLAQIAYEIHSDASYGNKIAWVHLDQIEKDAWENAIDAVLEELKDRVEDKIDEENELC